MLELVDSGLYFVQDENNLITPLLQVGSNEKSTESGGPKINGSDRIRILISVELFKIFLLLFLGSEIKAKSVDYGRVKFFINQTLVRYRLAFFK